MTLIAIGGAEDKQGDMTVHKRVLAESRGAESRVCVLTSATSDPVGAKERYEAVYHKLGVAACDVLHIDSRAMANSDAVVAVLAQADVLFMTGGDQLRLTQMLAGTRAFETIQDKYQANGLVIAGTSAGAAAASQLMIYGGDPEKAMEKGEVQMTSGLGFVPGVVFDTHFSERDRITRLFNAVATHPATIGIGLDEDTAVVVRRDKTMEVVGSGTVTFVDGTQITKSNIADVERGDVMTVEGYNVHKLPSGSVFDLHRRAPKSPS